MVVDYTVRYQDPFSNKGPLSKVKALCPVQTAHSSSCLYCPNILYTFFLVKVIYYKFYGELFLLASVLVIEFLRRLVKINQILGRKSTVRQELDMNLEIKVIKNASNKKCSPKLLFYIEKRIGKIRMILD